MRDYSYKLNLVGNGSNTKNRLKQYDKGNRIEIELYNTGVMQQESREEVTSADTITAIWKRVDGTIFDRECYAKNGNIVTYTDDEILALAGQLELECIIYRRVDNMETSTTTDRLYFTVEESLDRNSSITSDPNYTSTLIDELIQVKDTTITKVDKNIADILAHGQRLSTNEGNINKLMSDMDLKNKQIVIVGTVAELREALTHITNEQYTSKIMLRAGTYDWDTKGQKPMELPANTYLTSAGNGEVIINCEGNHLNNIFHNKLDGTEQWYTGAGNIIIENITFDGKNNLNTITPIAFGHAENCVVRNCTFKNFNQWHNIELNGCKNCYIENNKFEGYGLLDATNATEVIQLDLMLNSETYPWTALYDKSQCQRIFIRNNTFDNIKGTCIGGHNFDSSFYHQNIYINNNLFLYCDYCIRLGDTNNIFIDTNKTEKCGFFAELLSGSANNVYNWYLTNNDYDGVQGVKDFHGKDYSDPNTEGRFLRMEATNGRELCCNGLVITGNHINNANTHGITFTANFITCSNNFVRGCGKIGIFAYGCSQGIISSNVMGDNGKYGVSNRDYGIMLGDNANKSTWRVIISNNVCHTLGVYGSNVGSSLVMGNISTVIKVNNPSFVDVNNYNI